MKYFISLIFLVITLSSSKAQPFDHIISTNTTWDTDPNLTGSIWIQAGACLNITNGVTVRMPDYAYFFVDVTASLIADGVSFQADENVWYGIMCCGTNSIFSTAPEQLKNASQPLVIIQNSVE